MVLSELIARGSEKASVVEPKVAEPFRKATMPVADDRETVVVSITFCPAAEGFG